MSGGPRPTGYPNARGYGADSLGSILRNQNRGKIKEIDRVQEGDGKLSRDELNKLGFLPERPNRNNQQEEAESRPVRRG